MKSFKSIIAITALLAQAGAAHSIDLGKGWETVTENGYYDLRCDYKIAIYENASDTNPKRVMIATSIEPVSISVQLAHTHLYDVRHDNKLLARYSYYTGKDPEYVPVKVYKHCPKKSKKSAKSENKVSTP